MESLDTFFKLVNDYYRKGSFELSFKPRRASVKGETGSIWKYNITRKKKGRYFSG